MKIYLVGGAVRDRLLHYPVYEKDWVVVGATPEQLLAEGFQPVGKDFPVFLHPETKDEYALARTERKTGHGYKGFDFYAAPQVSLEQDLIRRDLSINAIAEDEHGEIVDPYGGCEDIKNKILRHVSPAFAEDPVRILRLARFAARYKHLGFSVAEETMELAKNMVANGEVDHLVPDRVWKETSRALMERDPQVYFQVLRQCGALKVLMPELDALFGVPQRPEHHPEVDTGVHSLMVLQQALVLGGSLEVRFASLCHDLGKGLTPKELWPAHHGHEDKGQALIEQLCQRLGTPNSCRDLAILAAKYHTHCHRALELKASTIVKTLEQLDAFRRPDRFAEFLLCCEADARGRTGFEDRDYPQRAYFAAAFEACRQVDVKALVDQGFKGKDLGERLHKERINAVKAYSQAIKSH